MRMICPNRGKIPITVNWQRGHDKTSYRGSNRQRDDEADLYPLAATSVYLVIFDYLVTLSAQLPRKLSSCCSAVFANIVFLDIDYSQPTTTDYT